MLRMAAFLVLLAMLAAYGGFKLHVIYDTYAAEYTGSPASSHPASHVITQHLDPIAQADADARALSMATLTPAAGKAAAGKVNSVTSCASPLPPVAVKPLAPQEAAELLRLISRSDSTAGLIPVLSKE